MRAIRARAERRRKQGVCALGDCRRPGEAIVLARIARPNGASSKDTITPLVRRYVCKQHLAELKRRWDGSHLDEQAPRRSVLHRGIRDEALVGDPSAGAGSTPAEASS